MNWFEETTPKYKAVQIRQYFQINLPDPSDWKPSAILAIDLLKVHCPKILQSYWDAVLNEIKPM